MAKKYSNSSLLTPDQTQQLDEKVKTFAVGAQRIINDYYKENLSILVPERLEIINSKRFVKVVAIDQVKNSDGTIVDKAYGRRVYAFLDKLTGDVLKPAGWDAPAKNARGNLFDEHNGLKHVNQYGPAYMDQM